MKLRSLTFALSLPCDDFVNESRFQRVHYKTNFKMEIQIKAQQNEIVKKKTGNQTGYNLWPSIAIAGNPLPISGKLPPTNQVTPEAVIN